MIRRYNTRFSIIAAGPKASGKSSFFNNLVGKTIIKSSPAEINIYMLNLDCEGVVQKITLVDTPGFDTENDAMIQKTIIDYIQEQFELFMEEETKIRRNTKYEDTRVHCLLYFIPATGFGLTPRDIDFLKTASQIVNIIPIISKADGLTVEECKNMKEVIKSQLNMNEIKIFDLENEEFLSKSIIDLRLNSSIPFTSINASKEGKRERICPAGIIDLDNARVSDSMILKEVLLSSHLDALIEMTNNELYENYRVEALEKILPDE